MIQKSLFSFISVNFKKLISFLQGHPLPTDMQASIRINAVNMYYMSYNLNRMDLVAVFGLLTTLVSLVLEGHIFSLNCHKSKKAAKQPLLSPRLEATLSSSQFPKVSLPLTSLGRSEMDVSIENLPCFSVFLRFPFCYRFRTVTVGKVPA